MIKFDPTHISSSVLLSHTTSVAFNFSFFFFNDTATTEIYTLSLHDALPISHPSRSLAARGSNGTSLRSSMGPSGPQDRKSTRLNSSHANISYAVFCLKKKKKITLKNIATEKPAVLQRVTPI